MDDHELEMLLSDIESDRVERKASIADALKNLGYVQRFGIGIALARKELQKNNNPPLEFRVEDAYILATIRSRP